MAVFRVGQKVLISGSGGNFDNLVYYLLIGKFAFCNLPTLLKHVAKCNYPNFHRYQKSEAASALLQRSALLSSGRCLQWPLSIVCRRRRCSFSVGSN